MKKELLDFFIEIIQIDDKGIKRKRREYRDEKNIKPKAVRSFYRAQELAVDRSKKTYDYEKKEKFYDRKKIVRLSRC